MPILRSLFGQKNPSNSSHGSSERTPAGSSHNPESATSNGYVSDGNKAAGDNLAASSSSLTPAQEVPAERISSHNRPQNDYDALYRVPESSTSYPTVAEERTSEGEGLMAPGEWAKSIGNWFARASDALPSRQRIARSARQTWRATQLAWDDLTPEQKIRMVALAFASAAVVVLVARGGPRLLSQRKKGIHKRHRRTKHKKANEETEKSDACERGHEIIREAKSPVRETHGGSGVSRKNGSALYDVFFTRDKRSRTDSNNIDDSESAVSIKTEEPNGSTNGVHEEDAPPIENPPLVQRKHHHRHNHMDKPVGTKIERDSDYLASKVASAYTGAFVLPLRENFRKGTVSSTESRSRHHHSRPKTTGKGEEASHPHVKSHNKRHNQTESATTVEEQPVDSARPASEYRIDTSKVVARPEPTTHASLASSKVKNPKGWLDIPEYNPKQYLTPTNMPVSYETMSHRSKLSDGYRSLENTSRESSRGRTEEAENSASVLERASVSPLAEKSHRRALSQPGLPFGPTTTSHSADSQFHRLRSTTAQHSRRETHTYTGSYATRIGGGPAVVHAPTVYGTAYTKDPHRSYVERSAGLHQINRHEKSTRWSAPRHQTGALSRSQLEDHPRQWSTNEKALSASAINQTPTVKRKNAEFAEDEIDHTQYRFMGSLSPGREPASRRNSHDVRRSLMDDDFDETEPSSDTRSEIGLHDGVVPPRHGKGKRGVAGNRIRGGVDTGVSFGLGPRRTQPQSQEREISRKRQQQTNKVVRRTADVRPGLDENESLANSQRQSPSPKPPALPPRHGPEAEAAKMRRERADEHVSKDSDQYNGVGNTLNEEFHSGNGDHLDTQPNGVNRVNEGSDERIGPYHHDTVSGEQSTKSQTFITDGENTFSAFSFPNGTVRSVQYQSTQYLKREAYVRHHQEGGVVEDDKSGKSSSEASRSPASLQNSPNINGSGNGNVAGASPGSPTDMDHITRTLGHRVRKSE